MSYTDHGTYSTFTHTNANNGVTRVYIAHPDFPVQHPRDLCITRRPDAPGWYAVVGRPLVDGEGKPRYFADHKAALAAVLEAIAAP